MLSNINKSLWKKALVKIASEMTMLLELSSDTEKIRKRCSNNWRYGLNRSTKNKLKIKSGATANPIVVNETLYLITQDGKLRAFR